MSSLTSIVIPKNSTNGKIEDALAFFGIQTSAPDKNWGNRTHPTHILVTETAKNQLDAIRLGNPEIAGTLVPMSVADVSGVRERLKHINEDTSPDIYALTLASLETLPGSPNRSNETSYLQALYENELMSNYEKGIVKINDEFKEFIEPYTRNAAVPILGAAISGEQASRYFGTPWVPDSLYQDIKNDAGVFNFQIDMDEIPSSVLSEITGNQQLSGKILSLFADGELVFPYLMDKAEPGSLRDDLSNPLSDDLASLSIIRWAVAPCHPHPEALDSMGLEEAPQMPSYPVSDDIEVGDYDPDMMEWLSSRRTGKIQTLSKGDMADITEQEYVQTSPRTDVTYANFELDHFGGYAHFAQGDDTPEGGQLLYQFSWGERALICEGISPEVKESLRSAAGYWGSNQIFLLENGTLQHFMACD